VALAQTFPPVLALRITSILRPECYTARKSALSALGRQASPTVSQREVSMDQIEALLKPGPFLYLLIVWGVVTAIFLVLIIWRSVLTSHEDDQIFLDSAEEHMATQQRELVSKINKLSRPILTSGIMAGVLLLAIAGIFVYNGLKNF
jgi:hypothetical protein